MSLSADKKKLLTALKLTESADSNVCTHAFVCVVIIFINRIYWALPMSTHQSNPVIVRNETNTPLLQTLQSKVHSLHHLLITTTSPAAQNSLQTDLTNWLRMTWLYG